MNNSYFAKTIDNILNEMSKEELEKLLQEDLASLIKSASKEKKDKIKKRKSVRNSIPKSKNKTGLNGKKGTELEPDKIKTVPKNSSEKLAIKLEPMVTMAESLITSIKNSFEDSLNGSKKMKDYFERVKNWEKQIRGSCQQIITIIESEGFDTTDSTKCSPMAYKTIFNYNSRDRSAMDLCAAIITFVNSLK